MDDGDALCIIDKQNVVKNAKIVKYVRPAINY